jgi:hypothetical protein
LTWSDLSCRKFEAVLAGGFAKRDFKGTSGQFLMLHESEAALDAISQDLPNGMDIEVGIPSAALTDYANMNRPV